MSTTKTTAGGTCTSWRRSWCFLLLAARLAKPRAEKLVHHLRGPPKMVVFHLASLENHEGKLLSKRHTLVGALCEFRNDRHASSEEDHSDSGIRANHSELTHKDL